MILKFLPFFFGGITDRPEFKEFVRLREVAMQKGSVGAFCSWAWDKLTDNSPIFLVDRIKTQLFVAQGTNDPHVNKSESDQMVEALRTRGVDVDYMVKDNEGHGFANEENRFEFYEAMEAFLAKYLK